MPFYFALSNQNFNQLKRSSCRSLDCFWKMNFIRFFFSSFYLSVKELLDKTTPALLSVFLSWQRLEDKPTQTGRGEKKHLRAKKSKETTEQRVFVKSKRRGIRKEKKRKGEREKGPRDETAAWKDD